MTSQPMLVNLVLGLLDLPLRQARLDLRQVRAHRAHRVQAVVLAQVLVLGQKA